MPADFMTSCRTAIIAIRTAKHIVWPAVLVLCAIAILPSPSSGQLVRVGPVSQANGFPQWYQDSTGLALNACLPNAQELADGTCLVTPDMLSNPGGAISFPTNFPDEFFFYALDSSVVTVNGGRGSYRARIEGAFVNGGVAAGDQMVFARIRIRVDIATPGTFTVTHPFGVEVFPDVQPGPNGINFTSDVGITAGAFSEALAGQITAFIGPADAPGGNPLPPVLLPGGHTWLADPAVEGFITGSPFGTNFVRIDGPDIGGPGINSLQIDTFTVMGQVHTQPIPSPVEVTRATYRRDSNSAQADVFAIGRKTAGQGTLQPVLSITGTGILGTLMDRSGDFYFGQPTLRSPQELPASVVITNSADTPTSFTEANLVDEVHINSASYNSANKTLLIQAVSSDTFATPTLTALGWGPLNSGQLTVSNVAVPPAEVIVVSNFGGRAARMVDVSNRDVDLSAPFADNDVIASALPADIPSLIQILANDLIDGQFGSSGCSSATCLPTILANPVHGTVTINGNGEAVYTPAPAYSGPDSFSYYYTTVPGGLASNLAQVTFNVQFQNHPPVANPDSATASIATPITINVLANDTDPDPGDAPNPATVTVVSPPSSGSAVPQPDGTIRFTPGASGTFTFQYTVQDNNGAPSNAATVTVNVVAPDIITVAQAQFRTGKREWRIRGTNTIPGPGNTVTIHIGTTLSGPVLGTIAVDVTGAWDFRLRGSSLGPDSTNTVSVESTQGGQRLAVPVQITN
jgi:hypothetical protein